MTIASQHMTLEGYLNVTNDADTRYELEDGELLVMPPESEINRRIAIFLLVYFAQLGLSPTQLTMKTEIVVSGTRETVRVPDLMVLSEELVQTLEGASRSTVMLDMLPPELVVEVVSPGKANEDRDYRYKRSQYQARGIQEYWIIDPMQQQVMVLSLLEGLYVETVFEGETEIVSNMLKAWGQKSSITAAQVLKPK
ncbi:MAG: Uma2 family endonuclease [Cyanobacteria bacterium J06627_8]